MKRRRPRGACTNFTPNLVSRVWPLGGGRRVCGVVRRCYSPTEPAPSSPRWALLGRAEEERESRVEMRAKMGEGR